MTNESAVISSFKKVLRHVASNLNRHFDDHSLGPQDRHVLADDFWVTYDNFAIVESKWSEQELPSEGRKGSRVSALCKALSTDPLMATLHAQCHRIAWRDSQSGGLVSQEYRKVVCCKLSPKTCDGLNCDSGTMTVDDFAKEFFGDPPSHCLPSADFQRYVNWLTKVVTGTERTITVLAQTQDSNGFTIFDEMSLQELCESLPPPPATHLNMRPKY